MIKHKVTPFMVVNDDYAALEAHLDAWREAGWYIQHIVAVTVDRFYPTSRDRFIIFMAREVHDDKAQG